MSALEFGFDTGLEQGLKLGFKSGKLIIDEVPKLPSHE